MQGARRGTRPLVSRIRPRAAGGAKPLSHPGCPGSNFFSFLFFFFFFQDPVSNRLWESLLEKLAVAHTAAFGTTGGIWAGSGADLEPTRAGAEGALSVEDLAS